MHKKPQNAIIIIFPEVIPIPKNFFVMYQKSLKFLDYLDLFIGLRVQKLYDLQVKVFKGEFLKSIFFIFCITFCLLGAKESKLLNEAQEAYKRGDYKMAIELFERACENKEGKGCSNLASMYDKGEGVKKNKAKAMQLFQKACDSGDMGICILLGIIYEDMEQSSF